MQMKRIQLPMAVAILFIAGGVALADEAPSVADGWRLISSTRGDLPAPNDGSQQTCCVVADLDKDGRDDFIVGERTNAPAVVWYRFDGARWTKQAIDEGRLKPEAGGVCCDVDRDGDLDLILGQDSSGAEIWWWENPFPDFDGPWTRRTIKSRGAKQHHDQTAGDFDGDGDLEFVTWNQRGKALLLYDLPEEPKRDEAWPSKSIFQWDSGQACEGFPSTPVDIDGDGTVDIVGGGRWFKHVGAGRFKSETIDDTMRFTQCAAGQLIEGGRPEVVLSPGDYGGVAKWYAWKDGKWIAHELEHVEHGHTCEMADIDGDRNLDILIGEMGDPGAGDDARVIIWHGDGKGGLRKEVICRGQGIHEGLFGDFDGDGDLDILLKPYHHNAPRIDLLMRE